MGLEEEDCHVTQFLSNAEVKEIVLPFVTPWEGREEGREGRGGRRGGERGERRDSLTTSVELVSESTPLEESLGIKASPDLCNLSLLSLKLTVPQSTRQERGIQLTTSQRDINCYTN